MPTDKLDRFDRKILEKLQADGRMPNIDLAAEIGLSPSPCSRRVRLLEERGVIKGYSAVLDQEQVGLGLTVFVGIKVERHREKEAEAFREAVSVLPEVVMAHLVSGESDFMLQVVVPDLRAYENFLTTTLLKLPGVRDIRSNFAIQTVKPQSPLPLAHLPA
ncbi:Lrp/AsnC family transcriptional regulator [Marinobacter sp. HL-58]|uniref:Lrp/AsnC family transcriptional regulator n=1 Tax=Marinobacter sp. HL-58 TaxID=1479237 RepID=UPI000488A2AE|nr:Lrp/AsnC family transcriptional regulator [Marinobacter sp. HL-58]